MARLSNEQWQGVVTHLRSKVVHLVDATSPFIENTKLREELQIPHKGFYVGIVDSTGTELICEGFLQEDLVEVLASVDVVANNVVSRVKDDNIQLSAIKTATLHLSLVADVTYLPDPLQWDEKSDGVYFQWGQDFQGFYLPYQIRQMGLPKIDVMDRLCTFNVGIISNAWKMPEGLIFKMTCQTFST